MGFSVCCRRDLPVEGLLQPVRLLRFVHRLFNDPQPQLLTVQGTTEEFCGGATVPEPHCSGNSLAGRVVGYYEGWSQERSCQSKPIFERCDMMKSI